MQLLTLLKRYLRKIPTIQLCTECCWIANALEAIKQQQQ